MTATRFWWVRHGPTGAQGMVGWTDLPADLSDAARIARLSAYLPQGAALASSDLVRAVSTADALAAAGRRRLAPDPDLRELHFGDWEMQRYDEIDEALLRPFYDSPGPTCAPGGESWDQIRARVFAAVDRLLHSHAGGDVIVVSHLGAILTQVQRALDLPARDAFARRIEPLSVTRVVHEAGRWRLEAIDHRP